MHMYRKREGRERVWVREREREVEGEGCKDKTQPPGDDRSPYGAQTLMVWRVWRVCSAEVTHTQLGVDITGHMGLAMPMFFWSLYTYKVAHYHTGIDNLWQRCLRTILCTLL